MFPARATILFKLKLIRRCLFVLVRNVILAFALTALKMDYVPHVRASSVSYTSVSRGLIQTPAHAKSLVLLPVCYIYCKPYLITSPTTPAPTVLPPSRIANLSSFSIAIGQISSISNITLSPGITISTPAGKVATPVTSVVLK